MTLKLRDLAVALLLAMTVAASLTCFATRVRADARLWLPVVRLDRPGPGAYVQGRAWWWDELAPLDPGPAHNQGLGLARVGGDASPPTFVYGPRDPTVWTGKRGEFEFERVRPGEYVLVRLPTVPVPGATAELVRRPWNGTLYYVPVDESATDGEPEMVEIGRVYLEREHGSRIVHNPSRCEDRGFEVVERRGW